MELFTSVKMLTSIVNSVVGYHSHINKSHLSGCPETSDKMELPDTYDKIINWTHCRQVFKQFGRFFADHPTRRLKANEKMWLYSDKQIAGTENVSQNIQNYIVY